MLSQAQRAAILELQEQRMSKREIARVLGVSRLTVRKVLQSNSVSVPEIQRPEKAEPYRQQILDLLASCKGTSCESMRNSRRTERRCRIRR
jgi:transposase